MSSLLWSGCRCGGVAVWHTLGPHAHSRTRVSPSHLTPPKLGSLFDEGEKCSGAGAGPEFPPA